MSTPDNTADKPTTRGIEWLAFWHKRMTEYWSLGTISGWRG
jgi:hypothetical protein